MFSACATSCPLSNNLSTCNCMRLTIHVLYRNRKSPVLTHTLGEIDTAWSFDEHDHQRGGPATSTTGALTGRLLKYLVPGGQRPGKAQGFFPQRTAAALRAISFRRFGLSVSARRCPPMLAPICAISRLRAGESFLARRLASSTAAGFFWGAFFTRASITYVTQGKHMEKLYLHSFRKASIIANGESVTRGR
jgi:hypothetical protein